MSKLFISYRRSDSADATGRLYDRLKSQFGDENIFLDIHTNPFGVDFRQCIRDAVNQCEVLLAVIGDHWLDARYADGAQQGSRRLDDPQDYVRIEIESALARGIPVVPLLVGTAAMPTEEDLPDCLKELAFRHAAEARAGPYFDDHVDRLIRGLDKLLERNRDLRGRVETARGIASSNPKMALRTARDVLELVVRDVYEWRLHEPPGKRPLESLIQRLESEEGLAGRFDATALLDKLSAHSTAHWGETMAPADVDQSLAQLTDIVNWYIEVVQPDALGQSPAKRAKPSPTTTKPAGPSHPAEVESRIVPKGLRSFDEHDSDFFLQLLPGPRDKDGLPESIRFWKHRIESRDDPGFTVGVIYGPSGSGKSSLVKAGLLPRLAKRVVPVYVEATPAETEARIQSGLRKKLPGLGTRLDLTGTIAALRRGRGLSPDQKVVLVVDQFEQWLDARRGEQETELARALRQCDGDRVQCVVMVRDDFGVSLNRFMGDLRIEILQGRNAAFVDLFDLIHARNVLIEFGRAFGRLPESDEALIKAHETFLTHAIEELAEDSRVISIRLAMFAEMVKSKPWVAATLKAVGGTQGVGLTFLEETFRSPALGAHQKAGRTVLKALLPESGSKIKGNVRSREELLQASGYAKRPEKLDALLRILDREPRLIKTTEGEEKDELERMNDEAGRTNNDTGTGSDASLSLHPAPGADRSAPGGSPATLPTSGLEPTPPLGGPRFQLTHDYLVPSLRDWLTRKQRETRRGRAELLLAERAAFWIGKRENRQLPTALEWAGIRALTKRRDWTETERRMMMRAGRVHGERALVVAGLLSATALLVLGITLRNYDATQQRVAEGLVDRLFAAKIAHVPEIVKLMREYRQWVDPLLRQVVERSTASDGSPIRLRASLALLEVDDGQVGYLSVRLPEADADEMLVLRDALKRQQTAVTTMLWPAFESYSPGDMRLLPAASALALYDPQNARWAGVANKTAEALVQVNSDSLPTWRDALKPVKDKLADPLAAIFRDQSRTETTHSQATNILTAYARDKPNLIASVPKLVANVLMDSADPKAYAALVPVAQRQREDTLPLFQAEVRKQATDQRNNASLDPASPAVGEQEAKDRLAQRRARAAIALIHMGRAEEVWPLLRHGPDPRLRSFIINSLNPLGADPRIVAAESVRRGSSEPAAIADPGRPSVPQRAGSGDPRPKEYRRLRGHETSANRRRTRSTHAARNQPPRRWTPFFSTPKSRSAALSSSHWEPSTPTLSRAATESRSLSGCSSSTKTTPTQAFTARPSGRCGGGTSKPSSRPPMPNCPASRIGATAAGSSTARGRRLP